MSARAERRRAAKTAKVAAKPKRGMSWVGETALDAVRANGRQRFFEKTFELMESDDPRERAVAEFMMRGAWEAVS
jgi:hypothetical protein